MYFTNHLYSKYFIILNISIWLIDDILIDTTAPGQSGLGSNAGENENKKFKKYKT